MQQTVGSSMFSQVCLACEQALHLGYSREFTWQPYTKGDASTRGEKRSPFPHPWWLRRSLARSLASPTKTGEQWKYFTDQQSQGPYNTLRSPSVILVPSYESRERRKWPRLRLSSLVSRAFFSRSSRVTRAILVTWGSRFCLVALTERPLGQALIVHLKEVTGYTLRRFKGNDNSSN